MNTEKTFLQTHNPDYHKTVLINEVLEYLDPQPGKIYVDATFGGGGHTRALLQKEPKCSVIAFDWDNIALEKNGPALLEEFPGRLQLIWGNFAQMSKLFKKLGIKKVDGLLADFGTSQHQITSRQGFSFASDTPLDMRMSAAHYRVTAAHIVNQASEAELIAIFQNYGEERYTRKIARAICEARQIKPLRTTGDLVKIIIEAVPRQPKKTKSINPATRVFQALRIVVNKELDNIKTFLHHVPDLVVSGGRVVCISFHSLEDRLVKNYFRENKNNFKLLTPKVVVPTEHEIQVNPSSRSSKLRAAELI
jgi:16S rRNA (cytosine1402-N4)-methyltransferase